MKKKLGVGDIICFICAAALCAVPFIPFVSELDIVNHIIDGELVSHQEVIAIYTMSGLWYGYLFIPVGILVAIATIVKKDAIRYTMLGALTLLSGFWVYKGIKFARMLNEGLLFRNEVGYYIILGASVLVIVITLSALMKEHSPAPDSQSK